MSKKTILHLLLFAILGMTILTITACSFGNYQTNTYEVNEEFSNISIKINTADVAFVPSDDEICKVTLYEKKNQKHTIEVNNGTLMISGDKEWFDYIGIGSDDKPKITVHLPKAEYSSLVIEESTGYIEISKDFKFKSMVISVSTGDVKCYASSTESIKIAATTGDLCVEDISASSLDLTVTTGKVNVSGVSCEGDIAIGVSTGETRLTDVECKNLTSEGTTGDISLKNVIVTKKLSIERTTGDVKFDGSDAAELFVETTTGYVEGSLLTDKVFITETDNGRIDVPDSTIGARCEIITDTGDIKISISED